MVVRGAGLTTRTRLGWSQFQGQTQGQVADCGQGVEGEGGGPIYHGCQEALGSTDLIFPGGWLKEKVQAEDTLDNSEEREEQQVHVALANLVVGEQPGIYQAFTRDSRGSRRASQQNQAWFMDWL